MRRFLLVLAALAVASPALAQIQLLPPANTIQTPPGDAYPNSSLKFPDNVVITDPLDMQAKPPVSDKYGLATYTPVGPVSNGNATGFTVGASSALLIPADAHGRRMLSIKNESASASIAVCFGTCTAALNTAGNYTIGPQQVITWNTTLAVPSDSINAIASAASTPVTVEAH